MEDQCSVPPDPGACGSIRACWSGYFMSGSLACIVLFFMMDTDAYETMGVVQDALSFCYCVSLNCYVHL